MKHNCLLHAITTSSGLRNLVRFSTDYRWFQRFRDMMKNWKVAKQGSFHVGVTGRERQRNICTKIKLTLVQKYFLSLLKCENLCCCCCCHCHCHRKQNKSINNLKKWQQASWTHCTSLKVCQLCHGDDDDTWQIWNSCLWLRGWYGCVHACGDGHNTGLV